MDIPKNHIPSRWPYFLRTGTNTLTSEGQVQWENQGPNRCVDSWEAVWAAWILEANGRHCLYPELWKLGAIECLNRAPNLWLHPVELKFGLSHPREVAALSFGRHWAATSGTSEDWAQPLSSAGYICPRVPTRIKALQQDTASFLNVPLTKQKLPEIP